MSGEALPNGEHLNVVSLRDYVDIRFSTLDDAVRERAITLEKAVNARAVAMDEAVRERARAMEKRLEGMNEFRDTLKDQASRLCTREEHEAQQMRIDKIEQWQARMEGKASQSSVNMAFFISASGIVLAIVGIVINFF